MTRVLLAGLPRSGTSWTGRVVGRADGATFVHEPDGEHEPFAIRAKRGYGRHIVLDPDTAAPEYERLWSGAFAGGDRTPNLRARVAERLFETASLQERSAARRGESVSMRMRAALALAVPPGPVPEARHVVVKSVHCALSIEWIVQRFSPTVLVVERDPRNVMASWMDLGMGGDRRENEVLARVASERWGLEAPPSDAPKLVQRTFVFGVLATALREAAQRNPTWIVASHDDLCRDPEPKFAALLERLGLEYGEAAHEYVVGSDRAGEGFRTQRRTRDQPEKWRERLTPEDAAAIEQELDRFPVRLIGHD